MAKLAIAYWSGSGSISLAAQVIADSARGAGVEVAMIDVSDMRPADWQVLADASGILFGTPTYMGGPAAGFKTFMDATGSDIWVGRHWLDKLAGGFTGGVNTGGDKLATLSSLAIFAAQHGMIWVGQDLIGAPVVEGNAGLNVSGTFLGLAVNSDGEGGLTAGCESSARHYGERMALMLARLG
ncbi:flavodoxin family protein [Pseudooceanicola sp.]|uniref:flavodoxin family protein n=1 Tax=Pseudooceanicola sp. TaxID=1914328 RepID=UPI00261422D0|nr:flavodoxin family protein [Pseudooceanicola sp.]MDF1854617.1 flavodoxin family protein [Pseudooceanicola sp.]